MSVRKKCSKCLSLKTLDKFHMAKTERHGRSHQCKVCHKNYLALRYKRHGSRQKIVEQTKKRRKHLHYFVQKLKSSPCVDCKKSYEPLLMDFDHVGPKKMAISRMIHESFSKSSILDEIKNCELVCVACHKTRTYVRLQKTKKPDKYKCYTRNREFLIEEKSKPCSICSRQLQHWCMEFDHISSEKKLKAVSTLSVTGYSIQKVKTEIKKCQLLCCFCHRLKTAKSWAVYQRPSNGG